MNNDHFKRSLALQAAAFHRNICKAIRGVGQVKLKWWSLKARINGTYAGCGNTPPRMQGATTLVHECYENKYETVRDKSKPGNWVLNVKTRCTYVHSYILYLC